MSTEENKKSAEDAYAAFAKGDAEGAMENIDDSIRWTVRGDNALTGTYNGKQEVGELWAKFTSKEFSNTPHDFVAEGDKVIALTTAKLEGESVEGADVLTYNSDGKLVGFDTLADEAVPNRVFAK
jgi:ketosteroid isomerase-like protein